MLFFINSSKKATYRNALMHYIYLFMSIVFIKIFNVKFLYAINIDWYMHQIYIINTVLCNISNNIIEYDDICETF